MGVTRTRKKRTKEAKKPHDFSKPIVYDLSKIGTDEDCFGVMHDITADECRMCGDCELCSIVYSQMAHAKREKAEKKFNAKDLEEEALTGNHPKIREYIRNLILEKPIRFKPLVSEINTKFFEGKKEYEYIKQVVKDFNIFSIYKKEKKTYIKLNKDGR